MPTTSYKVRDLITDLLQAENLDAQVFLINTNTFDSDDVDALSIADIEDGGGKYYVIDGCTTLNDSEIAITFEGPASVKDPEDELDDEV